MTAPMRQAGRWHDGRPARRNSPRRRGVIAEHRSGEAKDSDTRLRGKLPCGDRSLCAGGHGREAQPSASRFNEAGGPTR